MTALAFMCGILSYFHNTGIIVSAILTLTAIILLNKLGIKIIIICMLVFYAGYYNANFRIMNSDALYSIAPRDGVMEGQIVSIPNNSKMFVKVKTIDNIPIEGKTYLNVPTEGLIIGDEIRTEVKLRRPFRASNPSQFDYGKYLRNYNAFTTAYSDGCEVIGVNRQSNWMFLRGLNGIRNNILTCHGKYLKSPNLEILGGIIFGDDAVAPPEDVKHSFLNSGLLHILAASGMNVAFIFGFWFCIMRFLKVPYRLNIIGGIIMVILYTLMTGLGPSVLRAALMLLFIQIGKLIDRDAHSIALLSFVAFVLLIYNPAYINDVGFQLSFIVTFGLLTMGKVLFDKFKGNDWIKGAIIIPVVAQIWVFPIQMFYFNTFSTYSIPANILTVPFLSIVSFGGFVSSILATIHPIADKVCMVFDIPMKYVLDCVVWISDYFSNLPNSIIYTPHPEVIQIVIYYLILMLITLIIKIGMERRAIIGLGIMSLLLLISLIHIPNKKLEVLVFDVGNADSFLIKSPKGKYVLIDTAKKAYKGKSTAKYVVVKYLKDRGIKELEEMILTHFDIDHAGGAEDVLNDIKVKQVYVNTKDRVNNVSARIFDTADEMGSRVDLAKNNEVIYEEDNLKLRTYIAGISDDNENSIITLLSYGEFDMLFMGDAGVNGFFMIKKDIPHKIEVLKVGHHGALNVVNDGMLKHLENEVAVISTGPNRYGHPALGTLDILRNTKTYRTDQNNCIKIISDGDGYNISTFVPETKSFKLVESLETIR